MGMTLDTYRAPRWLPGGRALGGNAHTIWPALVSRHFGRQAAPVALYRRERWDTPDGDFIDVDWSGVLPRSDAPRADHNQTSLPLLVLFHGLEGSSASHYARAFAQRACDRGWRFALPHFRGCSGETNRAPRAYHSGDFEEVGWMLARLREVHVGPMVAVGVSLGGNALLRWAQEAGESAGSVVRAVAAVSAPLDLAASGHAIGRGFNRWVYNRMFLRSLRPKALRMWDLHPGLFDRERLLAARNLYEFDDVFTGPVHGFAGASDYWSRASAGPHLHRIRIPALVLNALNDPFVPAESLPLPQTGNPHVTPWQPAHGGHVGFPGGAWPGHGFTLPDGVMDWLAPRL
jgi:predicted alpha/beta-fold hydrolase